MYANSSSRVPKGKKAKKKKSHKIPVIELTDEEYADIQERFKRTPKYPSMEER